MIIEFEQVLFPNRDASVLAQWVVDRNVGKGCFSDKPDEGSVHWKPVLREEIQEWLDERGIIYHLFRDRVKKGSVTYSGYFIQIYDDSSAIEFKLRWL